MFDVFSNDNVLLASFETLDDAMKFAKSYGEFVAIKGNGMEFVGKFGVAAPPADYEWKKDFSLYRNKVKKVTKRDADERDVSQNET